MRRSCFSLGMGRFGFVHFEDLRIFGQSRRTVFRDFVHYGKNRKVYGKSVRNIKGDSIHYDAKGRCVGFSTRSAWGKITHYDNRGKVTGYSQVIFGILFIQYESNKKER